MRCGRRAGRRRVEARASRWGIDRQRECTSGDARGRQTEAVIEGPLAWSGTRRTSGVVVGTGHAVAQAAPVEDVGGVCGVVSQLAPDGAHHGS